MINYNESKKIMDKVAKIPYPQIPNLYPNRKYAYMLYDSYAGKLGELTAVTQYIYEYINFNSDLSRIMFDISIQEMKHLDILGKILIKLGQSPYYMNSSKKEWSSNNVKYNIGNLQETMKFNIYTEDFSISEYTKILSYTKNAQLRKIFQRIILDEQTHKEIFKKIIE